jgi:hypothetical protein
MFSCNACIRANALATFKATFLVIVSNLQYLETNDDFAILLYFATSGLQSYLARCCFDNNNVTDDLL